MIETLQLVSSIFDSIVSLVAFLAILFITNRFVQYLESRENRDDMIIELLRKQNEQKE